MFENLVNDFIELFGSVFSDIFDWLYDFIFKDSLGLIKNLGLTLFDSFKSTIYDGSFIFIILGLIVFSYLLKLVINAVRG